MCRGVQNGDKKKENYILYNICYIKPILFMVLTFASKTLQCRKIIFRF